MSHFKDSLSNVILVLQCIWPLYLNVWIYARHQARGKYIKKCKIWTLCSERINWTMRKERLLRKDMHVSYHLLLWLWEQSVLSLKFSTHLSISKVSKWISVLASLYLKLRNSTCTSKIQRNGGCWFTCNEPHAFGPSLFKGNDISDKFWAENYINMPEDLLITAFSRTKRVPPYD